MDLGLLYPSLIAIIPGIEIRGAVVYSKLAGLDPFSGYIVPFLVSMAIVPLVYLGFEIFFDYLTRFNWFRTRIERIRGKVSKYVDRYGFLGLVIFVSIPLPGSGLYTGSLGAVLLGLDRKKAIPALYIGNLFAFLLVYFLISFTGFL